MTPLELLNLGPTVEGAAITEFRAVVKAVVENEFAAEQLPVRNDKLHESLGWGGPVAAVYPEGEAVGDTGIHQNMFVVVQVFGRYDAEINPEQTVNPEKIESWAWRFQRAMRDAGDPRSEKVWLINVREIGYPDDPTGNKTRFVAAIEGSSPLASLIETLA